MVPSRSGLDYTVLSIEKLRSKILIALQIRQLMKNNKFEKNMTALEKKTFALHSIFSNK